MLGHSPMNQTSTGAPQQIIQGQLFQPQLHLRGTALAFPTPHLQQPHQQGLPNTPPSLPWSGIPQHPVPALPHPQQSFASPVPVPGPSPFSNGLKRKAEAGERNTQPNENIPPNYYGYYPQAQAKRPRVQPPAPGQHVPCPKCLSGQGGHWEHVRKH